MSLSDARAAEKSFFATHPVFSKLDKRLTGVENLTLKLTYILATRIQHAFPDMSQEVNAKLRLAMNSLSELGDKPPTSSIYQREAFASAVLVWFSDTYIRF